MTRSTVVPSSTQVSQQTRGTSDGFDLDVSLVEVADPAGLVNLTDDNCGTTCGACSTNVAGPEASHLYGLVPSRPAAWRHQPPVPHLRR